HPTPLPSLFPYTTLFRSLPLPPPLPRLFALHGGNGSAGVRHLSGVAILYSTLRRTCPETGRTASDSGTAFATPHANSPERWESLSNPTPSSPATEPNLTCRV